MSQVCSGAARPSYADLVLSAIATWTATRRLIAAALIGVLVGVVVAAAVNRPLGVLCGIGGMGAVFVGFGLAILSPMSSQETREHCQREDFRPVVEELVVVGAAVASIVGIIVLLLLEQSSTRHVAAAIGLLAVFLTWGMLHLMYAARYAHLYYCDPVGGIDFNTDDDPSYRDFLYFSYNLGMTFQVSDNNVSTTAYRSVIVRHCLLSYVFGTVILAATVNLVAGIVTS